MGEVGQRNDSQNPSNTVAENWPFVLLENVLIFKKLVVGSGRVQHSSLDFSLKSRFGLLTVSKVRGNQP